MRPVATKFPVSQAFGSGATAGVDPYGSDPMAELVRLYGDYQPFGHAGLDIACPVGTPVYAMASGRVLWADWGTNLPGDDSGAGWASRWYLYKGFPGIVTVIQHPGWIGVYAHLSNNDAAPAGSVVREGDLIGLSGNTGGVAPHLHVEALINLSYVTQGNLIYGRTNPVPFFGKTVPGDSIGTINTESSTIKKDWFDMASKEDLRQVIKEENPWGYRNAKLEKDDAYALLRAARTYSVKAAADAAAALEIAKQSASKQGVTIDYAKIEAAVKSAIAQGIDLDATVTVKKAV